MPQHCPGCDGTSGQEVPYANEPCPGCPSCAEKDQRIADLEADLAATRAVLRRVEGVKVICLCGSTRFTDIMLVKQWELTKAGHVVLSWCALPDSYFKGPHIGDVEGVKDIVDEVHKRKIDLSDEVMILNVDGYTGESTRSELLYAIQHNKPIVWLEPDRAHLTLADAALAAKDQRIADLQAKLEAENVKLIEWEKDFILYRKILSDKTEVLASTRKMLRDLKVVAERVRPFLMEVTEMGHSYETADLQIAARAYYDHITRVLADPALAAALEKGP